MSSVASQSLVLLPQDDAAKNNREASTIVSPGGVFTRRCVSSSLTFFLVSADQLFRADIKSSETWLGRLDLVVNVMRARKKLNVTDDTYKRVKVAVLDTGLNADHGVADEVQYKDFVDQSQQEMSDNTSHGTTSVDLILKAYAEVDLFVARVFATDNTDGTTEPSQMAQVSTIDAGVFHSGWC